jgi:hypothetical protein
MIVLPNRVLFALYGEALARTCSDDGEAKEILELILSPTGGCLPVPMIVSSRVYLSCVLRWLSDEAAAIEQYTTFLLTYWCPLMLRYRSETSVIKWFRKNPYLMFDSDIRNLLIPDGECTSPVLEGLGGPSWLDERKRTSKTDHNMTKQCRQCHARPPQKKLFQCSRCKHMWYGKCQFETYLSMKLVDPESYTSALQNVKGKIGVSISVSLQVSD